MQSLNKSLRRRISVLSIVVATLMLSLVVIVSFAARNRQEAIELRMCLATVNEFVAAAIGYRATPGEEFLSRLEISAGRLLALADGEALDPNVARMLENARQVVTEGRIADLQGAVVDEARRMNAEYLRREEALFGAFFAYAVVVLVLSVVFVATRIRGRRQYSRLVSNAVSLMRQVAELLAFERESVSHEPEWAEEEELYRAAKEIEDAVREDRDMASQFVYGNLENFMPRLKRRMERLMPCDRLAVAFIDGDGEVVAESAALGYDEVHLEPGFRQPLSDTSLGDVAAGGHPRIISDLEYYYRKVHKSEGTELILREGMRSSLTFPIVIRDRCVGFLFASSAERNAYNRSHISRGERILTLLKQHIYFHYVIQQIVAATANAFVKLMERKDNETSLHITRMSRYSHAIARRLAESDPGVTPTMLREILWFAPLHDIGKIGIPDAVLLKPGKLDPEERRIIEGHVSIGVEVVETMDRDLDRIIRQSLLPTALDIISGHHEKFDGTGYPAGLAGEDIPLAGRITAVADVFDALTSRRPYKDALSVEEALEIMREGRGSHFDPKVFDAFLDTLQEIREVYEENKEV
jgi:HD-GYP domain-containing protein (c-di-GMP phosphodiesterase class II)